MIVYPDILIDWSLLAKASQFYLQAGFVQKETPFAIAEKYHTYIKPHDNKSFVLDQGIFKEEPHELVGSAEQGFIYLLLNNQIQPFERLFSITPCFRFDTYDCLHQPWFMKLELFHYSSNIDDLKSMITLVKDFLTSISKFSVDLVNTGKNTYDLEINSIEVASFGFRVVEGLTFIYGTGLALPRFSIANNKDIL